jgi:hypothetical protein
MQRVQLHQRPKTAAPSHSKRPAWMEVSPGHLPSKQLPQRAPLSAGASLSLTRPARARLLAEISAELSMELVADEVLYSAPSYSAPPAMPTGVSPQRRTASIIDLTKVRARPSL